MKKEQILAIYHQGPQAVVQLVQTLCQQIQQLQTRVEQLESLTKKKQFQQPSTTFFRR